MSDLLKEAINGLGINVPIYRTVENDGALLLYLYGGRVVQWPPSTLATTGADPDPDPVTTSPTLATTGGQPDPGAVTIPTLTPSAPPLPSPPAPPIDDLTAIPGIGKATAKALNNAGFNTFRSLIDAQDADILAVPKLNTYALGKIRSYLYVHFS